ncbi:hypothetical protein GGR53DRAFT_467036 [Hypoxylon sp. FL1150]|nr:hypothetical protein GGR53DRAFT_467036 [Hypoxylon sp. FL1150]
MPSDSINKPPHHDRDFWEKNFQKKSNYQGKHKQAPATKVRSDPWQSLTAIQLGLQPRSFEELTAERSYLLEMLQQHDQRARELFKRVPIVDEQWKMAETIDEQQRARKHRSWLRHRIGDIVEEERNILTRLSELYVEIQCQDRWHQVAREREIRNQGQQYAAVDYANLSPRIPVSPRTYYQVYAPPPHFCYHYPPYGYAEAANAQGEYSGVCQPPGDCQNASEAFEMDGTPIDNTPNSEFRKASTALTSTPDPKPKKRMSMPSLNYIAGREGHDLVDYHTSSRSSSLR